MTILIILAIILVLVLIWIINDFFNIIFYNFAPLIVSKKKVINSILDIIKPQSQQVIYELGSGSARFLQMAEKRFKNVKLIGLENSIIPFLFFSLILMLKSSKVKIRLQNIYKADLKDADFIYCYLFPSMMLKLGEKIRSECKPNTIFISYMFSVPNWKPDQIIKQDNGTVYFYKV